jgi:DNA modification methylase
MLTILNGDCLEQLRALPDESVQCCVTSPPYWGLRDYGHPGQIGLEPTPAEFVARLVEVFREVRRVLCAKGTLWLNLGDSYAGSWGAQSRPGGTLSGNQVAAAPKTTRTGSLDRTPGLKSKDLVGIPWRVAFALQDAGWYLRSDIIWSKPNPMPESVTDRPTKAHEYLFLLTKSERYYYDAESIKEIASCGHRGSDFTSEHDIATKRRLGTKPRPSQAKGSFNGKTEAMADTGQNAFRAVTEYRNKRTVWTVPTQPYADAHFATYPPDLIKPCILAGTKPGDVVLDPFGGSGTTGQVALELGRKALLIELNPEYVKLIHQRCNVTPGLALHADQKGAAA